MPEFTSSPIFLIIAAILGILLLIAIVKGAFRLFIWVVDYRCDPYRLSVL